MESDARLKDLEGRLARAEWRVKCLQASGMLLLLALFVASKYYDRGYGRAPFRVMDRSGNMLMEVSGSPDGTQTNLRLFPPGKDHVTVLYGHDNGGGLDLLDAGGRPLTGIGGRQDGKGRGIIIFDRQNRPVVTLGTAPEGSGLVVTQDGKQRSAAIGAGAAGGYLELYDGEGKPVGAVP